MRIVTALIFVVCLGSAACSSPPKSADAAVTAILSNDVLQAPFSDIAGEPVVLADELATGKVVALVFWQSWCGSCRAEAPALVAASRQYPKLDIIGVVSGPDEAVDADALERAILELGLTYRNVRDRDLKLTRAFDVRGTPTIVVLDARGGVRYRGHKSPDWSTLVASQ